MFDEFLPSLLNNYYKIKENLQYLSDQVTLCVRASFQLHYTYCDLFENTNTVRTNDYYEVITRLEERR